MAATPSKHLAVYHPICYNACSTRYMDKPMRITQPPYRLEITLRSIFDGRSGQCCMCGGSVSSEVTTRRQSFEDGPVQEYTAFAHWQCVLQDGDKWLEEHGTAYV